MLRPLRMSLVNVLLLKDDLSQAVRALTEAGCLEIETPRVLEGRESLKRVNAQERISRLAALRTRIEAIAEALELPAEFHAGFKVEDLRIDPLGIADAIEADCAGLEAETRRVAFEIKRDRQALRQVELTSWVVTALEERRVDPILVTGPVFIGCQIGTLPSEIFARTRRAMDLAGHAVYGLGMLGDRTFVASVTTADRVEDMTGGLKKARFEPITIRRDLVSGGHFDTQEAELAMWETRERLTENGLAILRLAKESEETVRRWLAEIDFNARILEAMNNFLEGRYTCLVTGWAPVKNLDYLKEQLDERCENPVEIITAKEDSIAVEGPDTLVPPTKFLNPRWLRPFELIVDLYGVPAYNAINPTLFVAFTFVFIFGAMFGDVGHGAILVAGGLAGWFLASRKSAMKNLGFVLAGCGLASIVFGLLYGEAFGQELHAYWTHPMEDPAGFLFYGVILGAVIINIGLFINIAQNLWAKHYKEAFFGEWGVSTLLFYWGAIFLFALALTGRTDMVTWPLLAALLVPPLVATAFGSQLVDRFTGRKSEADLPTQVFRPIELMLASLTNTISFVRVPAFALNHVALMGAVLLLAGLVQEQRAGGHFLSWIDILIGNIVVIALEGLIVFVQAMRLHYYEFFGKFFHHQGRRFRPLAYED